MSGPLLQSQTRRRPKRTTVICIRFSLLFLFLFLFLALFGLLAWSPWKSSPATAYSTPDGTGALPPHWTKSIRERSLEASKFLLKKPVQDEKVVVVEETRRDEHEPKESASPSDKHQQLSAHTPLTSVVMASPPPAEATGHKVVKVASHSPNVSFSSDNQSELDEGTGHKATEQEHRVDRKLVKGMEQEQQHRRGIYAITALDIDGLEVSLSKYEGKVLLIVNVASKCGYTDQNYVGLEKTYQKYQKYGLEILGFPCNQFGNQEAGSNQEIKAFCTDKYHVTFPIFSKIQVNGQSTHPLYKFLKKELPLSEGGGGGEGEGKDLGWNFFKFLVDKKGRPVKLFSQNFNAADVEGEIYKLIHE